MITPKTYSKIIHLQSDAIFNFLNKNLKNRATAEDLTQECFLKLWKNSLFLKEEVAKSWLFKTAYNLMLNHIRDNKKLIFMQN
jgi:RNA polymerase sigma-70 factor, ECF subfamily